MADRRPRIHVVVLNWNGLADTVECVESCRRLAGTAPRIVVVDNGSTDGSAAALRDRWPDVEVLETGSNLGYAGGNNVGMRHALAHGADYVWLLNNDTVVAPDCLAHLVAAAEADRHAGIVGGTILDYHRPTIVSSAGGTVDLDAGGLTRHLQHAPGPRDRVDYVSGACMLVPRRMIAEVGLLDDRYFLYFEDVDWCLRARTRGFSVRLEPRARVWHKEGAQHGGRYSPAFVYYSLRNRLYFMRRFAPASMRRCHWRQLTMLAFFLKNAAAAGPRACVETLALAVESYVDFYLHRTMGPRRRGEPSAHRPAAAPAVATAPVITAAP